MRAFAVLASFASLGLLGCSAPLPAGERALWGEDQNRAWVEQAQAPELEPAPVPEPSVPAIEPKPSAAGPAHPKVSASFEDSEGESYLLGLSAVEMPAIDVDTGIVVVPQLEILQLTTIVGRWELSWLGVDGYEESLMLVDDSPREVRRRVREANAKLRASRWRAMTRLAVALPSEDYAVERDAPASERVVEAITQHGELIVRIPGVRVLERHPLEPGNRSLHRIYADRDSGTVLAIFMACTGEDCTCDPVFGAQLMRFDPATFEWIDRRPCEDCEPIDFGFNDGDPWG